jgi:hypothetical protein
VGQGIDEAVAESAGQSVVLALGSFDLVGMNIFVLLSSEIKFILVGRAC